MGRDGQERTDMSTVANGLLVKLRTSQDAKAAPLMTVPFGTNLEDVLRDVGQWGISTDYGEFGKDDLTGQFVVVDGEAFFEVIVNVDDES